MQIPHAFFLAEPRPKIRECLTPRARCVAPRDLGLLKHVAICTAVRTGAKRGTYFVTTVYIGLRIVVSPYVNSWLAEKE